MWNVGVSDLQHRLAELPGEERASPMCNPPGDMRLLLLSATSTLLLLLVPSAGAETNLRWIQPGNSATVEEFSVFVGPTTEAGEIVYSGLPVPDPLGVYSAEVQIDAIDEGIPVYVWLTASNSSGESPPSNVNIYPEGCEPLWDSDCDDIPNDAASGAGSCATGQTLDCDDNCPYTWNPDQLDTGGTGVGSAADGIGDACQCGDVSGDGRVSSIDVAIIMRALMQPPRSTMFRPDLCDVGGSADCTSADASIAFRALMTPPLANIQQQCDPAQPLLQ